MVEKMKLVQIHGPVAMLDSFLVGCCMDGKFALEPATQYMSASLGYALLNEENNYPPIQQRIETMASQIGVTLPDTVPEQSVVTDLHSQSYLDTLAQKFDALHEERESLTTQQQLCSDAIEQYGHFLPLKANMDEITDCEHVKVRFGFLPTAGYNKLMNNYADDPYILFVPCTQTKDGYWGVYLTPRSKTQEVDGIFSMLFFEPLHVPGAAGSPAEITEHFKENLDVVEASINEVDDRVRILWQQNESKLLALYNSVRYLGAAFSLRHYAAVKGDHFFCVGWVPADSVQDISERAAAIEGLHVTVDDPSNAGLHNPPTKLKNAWWSRPFEFFVEMYGLPTYGETDITPFVALTFTILFGIMFGDVGQGIVLTLFSVAMWKLKGNELFHLMVPCGISSTIFGFVYGSVFGFEDLLDPLYHALGMPGKPIAVMESINTILLVAIFIGIVLVVAAMGIHIYTSLKSHRLGEAIFSTNGVVGVIAYLAGVNLCSDFMGGPVFLPNALAVVLLVAGLILLLLQGVLAPMLDGEEWRPADGWAAYFTQNIFELLESVLSYLSNTISFLRVGAFVIVHASMMMVVFTLAGDPPNMVVVALGNIVVIALEALLSGIQGIRLEFYEMFSRCYQGGGHKYLALNVHSKQKHTPQQ